MRGHFERLLHADVLQEAQAAQEGAVKAAAAVRRAERQRRVAAARTAAAVSAMSHIDTAPASGSDSAARHVDDQGSCGADATPLRDHATVQTSAWRILRVLFIIWWMQDGIVVMTRMTMQTRATNLRVQMSQLTAQARP